MGTFKESKSAPIHRWFQYPAGFSYRGVEHVLDRHGVGPGARVYDPFSGTGTTEVVCKGRGIGSGGMEAHPFVARIARTKVRWDYDPKELRETSEEFLRRVRRASSDVSDRSLQDVPLLVRKCYSPRNLRRLLLIRDSIRRHVPADYVDLFEVALIGTLRRASRAATGWPYIAPRVTIAERDGLETFVEQLRLCVEDLMATPPEFRTVPAEIVEGDCRASPFPPRHFDLAFTSPPYLNNYDYADRTRLEAYFTGFVRSWGEITERIRDHLIVAATTQVNRGDFHVRDILSPELKEAAPRVARTLQSDVDRLSELRLRKKGQKSYDLMVGQYFNDMTRSLRDTLRVLRPGSPYVLILGDSAPYGVHIPTETYLARIAEGLGFARSSITELRRRGGKWASNPQRHQVPLRESMLVLEA
jgi:DNA modification methylase